MKNAFWFREKYGPWALIAGGSDGLGATFAEALAKRGMNLVLLARQKDRLESATADLRERYGTEVIPLALDLADFERTKYLVNGVMADGVSIGLLVYNAAFAPIGLFENTDEDALSLAAAVNARTPLLLSKLLSGPMIQRQKGGIVFMSSLAGIQGSPRLAAYAATKSFNAVLAQGLWAELKPRGIDVTGCCAGAILTPGFRAAGKGKRALGSLTPELVVERTLAALGKGPLVVPGALNKAAAFLMGRLLPRKTAISIMEKNIGGLT